MLKVVSSILMLDCPVWKVFLCLSSSSSDTLWYFTCTPKSVSRPVWSLCYSWFKPIYILSKGNLQSQL